MVKQKRRIAFYFEPEWAFGSVHYELCKYLWAYDMDCQLIPWNRAYDRQEFKDYVSTVDLIVTCPVSVGVLLDFGVPISKIVLIAHHINDIQRFEHHKIDLDACAGYAGTTRRIVEFSKASGIARAPSLAHIGINTNTFYQPAAESLTRVGYAGSWGRGHPIENKRPYLVVRAAQQAGLDFHAAVWRQNSFTTMPGWYGSVDAVMVASREEGAALPALEAAAAGRLVLTSPVGSWPDRIGSAGGVVLPLEDEEYVAAGTAHLLFYKNNPEAYQQKCQQIQEHAQSYDWSKVIHEWVELLG